jgi:DNA-directed RNA polymerase subunit RPC12/RpoP
VKCTACGAESSLNPNVTAGRCPFCGSPIVTQGHPHRQIKPRSLLPFHVRRERADAAFKRWLDSLWFAPNDLKKFAYAGGLKGVYIPYWTYDANTDSHYTGQRGDDYWETQHYTTMVNGKPSRQTRQVRKTRWRSVSGQVFNTFDDILILASHSLPRNYTESLEPWDLQNLVPYADEYLAGFVAESYQMPLDEGFTHAKQVMDEHIAASIRRDIGGDHQRIHSTDTRYDDITFKHVLLPLWISAYRYRDRSFRFLVNARTAEVCGERPYSPWKITLAILAALLLVLIVLFFINQR